MLASIPSSFREAHALKLEEIFRSTVLAAPWRAWRARARHRTSSSKSSWAGITAASACMPETASQTVRKRWRNYILRNAFSEQQIT